MRSLGSVNSVEIKDGASGDIHEIFYRMPTNEERAAYHKGALVRKGKKIIAKPFENRLKYGAAIITGFKKGTLDVDGKMFSSESGDPDYREDWKDLLVTYAGDLIAAVSIAVFETTLAVPKEDETEVPLDE